MSKTVKKIISVVLCFAMLFGVTLANGKIAVLSDLVDIEAFAAEVSSGASDIETDGTFIFYRYSYWSENNERKDGWRVTECNEKATGKVVIPSTYKGQSVISLGSEFLQNCSDITDITVPATVLEIDSKAFYEIDSLINVVIAENSSLEYIGGNAFENCTKLQSIVIPKSVKKISYKTFKGCSSLNSVIFGEGSKLEAVDSYAFAQCRSLKTVSLPAGVSIIESYAFNGCSDLSSVIFSNESNLETIDSHSFQNCVKLKEITIPESVKKIGYNAFKGCSTLMKVNGGGAIENIYSNSFSGTGVYNDETKWDNGILYVAHCLIRAKNPAESVKIRPDTTAIANSAFGYCGKLNSVDFSESKALKIIGNSAFSSCYGLTEISVSEGVTAIGDYAFSSCSGIERIKIPASVVDIGRGAFDSCGSLKSIEVDPKNENYISEDVVLFSKDKSILMYYPTGKDNTEYSIPSEVASINEYAFYNNDYLKTLDLSRCSGLTEIGYEAFSDCDSITSFDFLSCKKLETIGRWAFEDCDCLAEVKIPKSVNYMDYTAFYGCNSLVSIIVNQSNESFSDSNGILFNKDKSELICYPNGKTEVKYIVPETVTMIGSSAFYGNQNLKSVDFSKCSGLININDGAFSNCDKLTAVDLSACSGLEAIGWSSFFGCDALSNVKLPSALKTIGDGAFYGCESLVKAEIPASVEYISDEAFSNCNSLLQIKVDSDNENYSDINGVLFNKDKSTLICYPNGKTDIKYTVPETVTAIDPYAFYYNPILTLIDFSKCTGLKMIGRYTFYYCNNLKEIDLSKCEKLREIGVQAFDGCDNVKNIVLPYGLRQISEDIFAHCSSLENVTIPASVRRIRENAFLGCDAVTTVTYTGTEQMWNKVRVYSGNDSIKKAKPDFTEKYKVVYDEVTDQNTGVTIEAPLGNADNDLNISVTERDSNTVYELYGLEPDMAEIQLFDIKLIENGAEVQPSGMVTVKIPVPDNYPKKLLEVHHIDFETGKKEKMDATLIEENENGVKKCYMVFLTDHFSYYALIALKGLEGVTVKTAGAEAVDYRTKATLKATAAGLDEKYHLVITVGEKEYKGNNKEVVCDLGEIKSDLDYSVKVVNSNGKTQLDADGKELVKDGGKITCNDGFFARLIAFFRGLFGLLPEVEIKP